MRTIILIIMTILFLGGAQTALPRNYVVCVGISDYPDTKNDLNLPARDAKTIKELYDKNDDAKITVLTDDDATVKKIIKAAEKQFSRAKAGDAIIFFFSGHGVPGGFVCYDGMLAYDDLSQIMTATEASSKIVFADACFAGMARNLKQYGQPKAETVGKTSILYFLSSRANERSREKKGWDNSLFTAFLDRGLRGGADTNRDRVVTAAELFTFVSNGVAKASNDGQHPVMWGKFDNKMPLMVWKK